MKRNRNQLVLPFNYEAIIDENDPVWKLVEICDTLNYSRLYDTYLRHWRIIDPVVMFEILVFAYMNGIYSSRKIEQAWGSSFQSYGSTAKSICSEKGS